MGKREREGRKIAPSYVGAKHLSVSETRGGQVELWLHGNS